MQFGFVANVTGTTFNDAEPGVGPDFSQTPPVPQNPFGGTGVSGYTVTAPGSYTTVPAVIVAAPPSGAQATAAASFGALTCVLNSHGTAGVDFVTTSPSSPAGWSIGFTNGMVLTINTVSGSFLGYTLTGFTLTGPGSVTGVGTSVSSNPIAPTSCSAGL